MRLITIDGHSYTQLDITDYEIGLEILDGEATGRTRARGWDMIRDPQGALSNLYLEIASTSSDNPEFVRLWELCESMSDRDFVSISYINPVGRTITQNVYIKIARLKLRKFERNGKVYTNTIKLSIIAQKGS